jgi:hypothetical protein
VSLAVGFLALPMPVGGWVILAGRRLAWFGLLADRLWLLDADGVVGMLLRHISSRRLDGRPAVPEAGVFSFDLAERRLVQRWSVRICRFCLC